MSSMWNDAALIGSTGFVGSTLMRAVAFAATYRSTNIEEIAERSFETIVCAGAPAVMWLANQRPEEDRANLARLADALSRARAKRVILISTIAVLDDASAGYDETSGRYEVNKPYGRHRRELEERIQAVAPTHVLRLPALFGHGLKKNFLFDILNPVPAFLTKEAHEKARNALSSGEGQLLDSLVADDAGTGMMKLDRDALAASGRRVELERAFARIGMAARSFTNSNSQFQYYNLAHLRGDIERAVDARLPVVHLAPEPWRAGDLHRALTGDDFLNEGPAVVREDMRTAHAGAFGQEGTYLYGMDEVLKDIRAFFAQERA